MPDPKTLIAHGVRVAMSLPGAPPPPAPAPELVKIVGVPAGHPNYPEKGKFVNIDGIAYVRAEDEAAVRARIQKARAKAKYGALHK